MARQPNAELGVWPWLTFWYGLSWESLAAMPNGLKRVYVEKLPELVNAYQRLHITAASFPHMTELGREVVMDTLNGRYVVRDGVMGRLADEPDPQAPRPTREQYITALRGYGIGFEEVQVTPSTTEAA